MGGDNATHFLKAKKRPEHKKENGEPIHPQKFAQQEVICTHRKSLTSKPQVKGYVELENLKFKLNSFYRAELFRCFLLFVTDRQTDRGWRPNKGSRGTAVS